MCRGRSKSRRSESPGIGKASAGGIHGAHGGLHHYRMLSGLHPKYRYTRSYPDGTWAETVPGYALDPNMTFAIALCAAIVERRGGMLIHGAIISREYGIPCVIGVPQATEFIKTGDQLTVDGYYGLVIRSPQQTRPHGGKPHEIQL